MAQVHRFGDLAAVSCGGPTRYMTAREARKLAAALYRVARSIETVDFVNSDVGTAYTADMAHNDIDFVRYANEHDAKRRAARAAR